MAKVINTKSPEIIAGVRAKGFCFVSLKAKGLHITKQVALMCGLSKDKYVHFLNDSNYWAFYVNDDPDGFRVCTDHSNGGFILYSRELSRMFIRSTGAKYCNRFFISEVPAQHNGNQLFEILTTATVEVIIDKRKRMDQQRKKEKQYVLNLYRSP